jgi:hypothetical protein
MTSFFIYLCIVAGGVALCIDWYKLTGDIYDGLVNAISWLGNVTEKAFYGLAYVMIQAPVTYLSNYRKGYSYVGKHRRESSDDSEVDRWCGADDRFADFLHTLNLDIHMNDQARA